MKDPVVFIGIPSGADWRAEFGMSLAGLVAYANTPLRGGVKLAGLRLWNTRGSILPRSRTTLARMAIESGATHLLFIDSDMVFPKDTMHRLLNWDKAVVACNCPTKMLPSTPTARLTSETRTGEPLYSVPDDAGLKQVWRVGTGVMMLRTSIFQQLKHPWFPMPWDEQLQDYRGEDWAFCDKLEQQGIPIYVDLGLSRHIGHVGDLQYKHEHVKLA